MDRDVHQLPLVSRKEYIMRKDFAFAVLGIVVVSLIGISGFAGKPVSVVEMEDRLPYIVSYTSHSEGVVESIQEAGGTVIEMVPEINLIVADSENPDFIAEVTVSHNVKWAVRDEFVQWLSSDSDVEDSELVRLNSVRSMGNSPLDAQFLDEQWHIFRTQTDLAWEITEGSAQVKVAVLDTGICTHHPDLAGKVDANYSRSYVPDWAEVPNDWEPACPGCPAWEDRNYHGTHVAGIISTNNLGTAGIAPNVRLRAVKVLNWEGQGFFISTILGIIYAANTGNDVITMSLGIVTRIGPSVPDDPSGGFFPIPLGRTLLLAALSQAVSYAQQSGALLVASAGNEGALLDGAGIMSLPCEIRPMLCVGSTTRSDALSDFSNHGTSNPSIMGPGGGGPVAPFPENDITMFILSPCSMHSVPIPECAAGAFYIGVNGTSQAAPQVAAAAALVDSIARRGPGSMKGGQLRNRLLRSADDLGAPGTDNMFSHGRLNVLRAVEE